MVRKAITKLQAIIAIIIVAVAGTAVYYYFYGVQKPPEKTEIVIGGTLTLSGTNAMIGLAAKRNWELAVEEWNKKGGIYIKEYGRKLPIRLLVYDDKFDTATVTSIYEHLITVEKVDFVFGCWGSPMYFAQTVITEKYGFPTITNNNADPIYARNFTYCFSIVPLRSDCDAVFLDWLAGLHPAVRPKTIAMIYPNDVGGIASFNGIQKWIANHPEVGFQLVFSEAFEPLKPDYTPVLEKVRAAGAEVFISSGLGGDAITIFRQYAELGLYHKAVFGGPGIGDAPVIKVLGDAAEFKFAYAHWHWDIPTPYNREYVEKYTAKYGEKPGVTFEGMWYSLANIFLECVEKVGTLQGDYLKQVRDAIANYEGETVNGHIAWKGKQVAEVMVPLLQIQGGETKIVFPHEWASVDAVYPHPKSWLGMIS